MHGIDLQTDDAWRYISGPVASEDLAHIPESPWMVVSGLNAGSPAVMHLIDTRTKRAHPCFPHGRPTGNSPDPMTMSFDGLNVLARPDGEHRLYVANHGDRHAIEVFAIGMRSPIPVLTWLHCVPMPAGTLANAVVPLNDGGFLVSSIHDPDDPAAWRRMQRGEHTGSVWEWHPARGFAHLPTGGISGGHGLELSADQRTVYVSSWSGRQLVVLNRHGGARRRIDLDFMPDNIKRTADGALLIAGQACDVASIAACGNGPCPQNWIVARIDPIRGTVEPLLTRRGDATINYACGALEMDGNLYITARGERSLAYMPLDSLPLLLRSDP